VAPPADLENPGARLRDDLVVVADRRGECIAEITTNAVDIDRIGGILAFRIIDLEATAHELRILAEVGLLVDVRILDRGVRHAVERTGHDRLCARAQAKRGCGEQQDAFAAWEGIRTHDRVPL
jgi:hypothetical protein